MLYILYISISRLFCSNLHPLRDYKVNCRALFLHCSFKMYRKNIKVSVVRNAVSNIVNVFFNPAPQITDNNSTAKLVDRRKKSNDHLQNGTTPNLKAMQESVRYFFPSSYKTDNKSLRWFIAPAQQICVLRGPLHRLSSKKQTQGSE